MPLAQPVAVLCPRAFCDPIGDRPLEMPPHPYLHLKRFSTPATSASLRQPRPALSRSSQSRATTSSPSELMGMFQSPILSQPRHHLPADMEGTSCQWVMG